MTVPILRPGGVNADVSRCEGDEAARGGRTGSLCLSGSSSPAPPEPQHMVALAEANRVRLAGAVLRREVAAGDLSIAEALVDERAATMTVVRLLAAQSRWGKHRAELLCAQVPVSSTKRVGELTERQRDRIVVFAAVSPARVRAMLREEQWERRCRGAAS